MTDTVTETYSCHSKGHLHAPEYHLRFMGVCMMYLIINEAIPRQGGFKFVFDPQPHFDRGLFREKKFLGSFFSKI